MRWTHGRCTERMGAAASKCGSQVANQIDMYEYMVDVQCAYYCPVGIVMLIESAGYRVESQEFHWSW